MDLRKRAKKIEEYFENVIEEELKEELKQAGLDSDIQKDESEKILVFEFVTTDFNHAIKVCEVAFGYEGEAWEMIKQTRDMSELANFLEEDGVDTNVFIEVV